MLELTLGRLKNDEMKVGRAFTVEAILRNATRFNEASQTFEPIYMDASLIIEQPAVYLDVDPTSVIVAKNVSETTISVHTPSGLE